MRVSGFKEINEEMVKTVEMIVKKGNCGGIACKDCVLWNSFCVHKGVKQAAIEFLEMVEREGLFPDHFVNANDMVEDEIKRAPLTDEDLDKRDIEGKPLIFYCPGDSTRETILSYDNESIWFNDGDMSFEKLMDYILNKWRFKMNKRELMKKYEKMKKEYKAEGRAAESYAVPDKYEITNEYVNVGMKKLYRIKALRDFGRVKKDDLGGFIENEDNLSHKGKSWVFDNAIVSGNAKIYENAEIRDNAEIWDNAEIYGNAKIYDNVEIYENAKIYGDAKVRNNAEIHGKAIVCCYAEIYGWAEIYGKAIVYDNVMVHGKAVICDNAAIYARARIQGHARVFGDSEIYGWAEIYGNAVVYHAAKIYGNAVVYGVARIGGEVEICGDAIVSSSVWT